MGTRALTVFAETADSEPCAYMSRQMDGGPKSHGLDLADILGHFKLVRGISDLEDPNLANGIDCAAATVVAKLKTHPGNIYLNQGTGDEDYTYLIYGKKVPGPIYVRINYYDEVIYDGTLRNFRKTGGRTKRH